MAFLKGTFRLGRTPEDLSKQYEPLSQTICNWVAQTDDEGRRQDGLTTAEREESCIKLRRGDPPGARRGRDPEKGAAWFRRPDQSRLGVRIRESQPSPIMRCPLCTESCLSPTATMRERDRGPSIRERKAMRGRTRRLDFKLSVPAIWCDTESE